MEPSFPLLRRGFSSSFGDFYTLDLKRFNYGGIKGLRRRFLLMKSRWRGRWTVKRERDSIY